MKQWLQIVDKIGRFLLCFRWVIFISKIGRLTKEKSKERKQKIAVEGKRKEIQ